MTRVVNANNLTMAVKDYIKDIKWHHPQRNPKLVILMASDNKASERYISNKVKTGEELGVDVEIIRFGIDSKTDDIDFVIENLNIDKDVDGIILQLPTYEHINSKYLIDQIVPYKDVDGLTTKNKGLLENDDSWFRPCTPKGVIDLLRFEGVNFKGKNVVIVGRGETAGAPMSVMFRNLDANVITCHSKTSREDLEFYIKHADIVISCVGKSNLIPAEWFKEDSIAIGVGFSYDENGKQRLDFDVDKIAKLGKASMVSQRTNCTGKATVLELILNTALAYDNNFK